MTQLLTTDLAGVFMIKPNVFEDHRGQYVTLYEKRFWEDTEFVEDDISVSHRGVLRGIHGNDQTTKLISCLYGSFYLVVLNWDDSSPQFRQWQPFVLSAKNRLQVLVPPKFGNGHLVLSDIAIFHYKQTTYYDRATQFTVKWDDPELNIKWPVKEPIVSERDASVFRPNS